MHGIFISALALALVGATPLAAQHVNGKVRYLGMRPPPENDKPYTGKLFIIRYATEELAYAFCAAAGKTRPACASRPNDLSRCTLILGPDKLFKAQHMSM